MTRLAAPYGSRIDRTQPMRFTFEGKSYEGFAGDCIASALAASDQWVLSRSFKYHRPRGIMTMAGAEANTLVQLPSEANVPADLTPIWEGMTVTAQNVNGSLRNDRDAIMDRLGRFMPVGFYYRTFMGPTQDSWLRFWEPMIRRKAGLGIVDTRAPHLSFDKVDLHCDLLVVGAGPAGLAAAIAAAQIGADVVLCDENPEIGGSLTYRRCDPGVLASLRAAAAGLANLRVMTATVCNGWYEDNWLPLIQGNRLYRARAHEVILATGAIEQPAVFRNNDLPGIMTVGAVQRLMRHYAVKPGRRAVVLAGNDDGYDAAFDLIEAGVELAAVVDPRQGAGSSAGELRARGAEIITGAQIDEAAGTRGNKHVRRVRVGSRWMDCDLVVMAVGSAPAWQVPCHAGAKVGYDEATARMTLTLPDGAVHLAGAVAGRTGLSSAMADGRRAAHEALHGLGHSDLPNASSEFEPEAVAWAQKLTGHEKGRDFVDLDEDLQVNDLQNAIKEGYRELELVKRFSTVGMGSSQGRHSALATARIVAEATDRKVGQVGVTTARPPTGPEKLGVLAGHHEPLERRTALHARHLALEARMKPIGNWWRPYYYGPESRSERLIHEEVAAVRDGVGMLDVSTLGKLEIRGPDAGAFLDRMYTMAHANQPVGRVRYCLMLNEMGTVIDDGVAYRFAEDQFYVTATTGAVARVQADMLFWNAQWRLKVDVLNVTAGFSGINVTGPKARDVLQALEGDIDFARDAFPYLHGRQGRLAGVPVHIMRIGFTGEVSFELHCPSSYAVALWDALVAAGKPYSLRPYGLEASRIMRLEKGHILIGQDTDALTTPDELGFGWAVSKKKPFFVGKRSIEMRANLGESRRLVGLSFEGLRNVPGESCLVLRGGNPVGQVTSVGFSPTLGHHIALAYVHIDDAAPGSRITVKCRDGELVEAPVVGHAFFDPQNVRQEL
ncbi:MULTISPECIES: 2Fe-2S iron-sulfur cluster-binding protein [unclassified Mesorhizobium]|uniref:2Fe-2S iron-sulfur cluster-binding protein n=1 Tax=unclassified Mesorhizobium TaxID=325217 RepID=UPI00112EDA5E|nr:MULTISPECIES: 2Fe-2S iron-sulfur cluster-binding protein [unclassified Mesorhizobium]MBZ9894507.1 (2Fe-2S)-binding protein [Mesorhizobium sp. BR1-1-6]TPM57554.1 FAD-dependent oxidoreductase [Mesorhizobium sp. B2-2-4]TPM65643.1 FAD-dependent oxidoreductase [Mesorhizobium sp. B2-2-1]TPN38446.1 FAD-dependent oxidoreductase [Mesorhizobium sp. B1-1-6]TPN71969.1 FAD-dependent oxidoreductase [Mesorhizobium sp. B1-1-3]